MKWNWEKNFRLLRKMYTEAYLSAFKNISAFLSV